MKAKVKQIASGALLILGVAVVLGAAGSSDLGAAGIGETVIRCVIGTALLFVGAAISIEGEEE